jgi:hypothetical protein
VEQEAVSWVLWTFKWMMLDMIKLPSPNLPLCQYEPNSYERRLSVKLNEYLETIRRAVNFMGSVYAYPPEYEVQHLGTLNGVPAKLFHIMGSRTLGWTSTSVLGDACEYLDTSQALINTPTSGQTLYLVSTSGNDTAAGTGARTVRTIYLDANGVQQVRTDTLNGTTPVNIGTGYTFIQWMEVATVGTGEVSAGNITISSTNGAATVATTFERITAGGNRSLSGRYKVPSDCHGHLIHWDAAAIGNTMDVRIRATMFMDDNTLSSAYHFLDRIFLGSGQNATQDLEYRELPANCIVKISAIPGGAPAGNKLDCSFSIICMEN